MTTVTGKVTGRWLIVQYNRLRTDKRVMTRDRDEDTEHEPNDTLIRHRDILKSRSLLEQGLVVGKILWVMVVLVAKLRIFDWLDARRTRKVRD